jgi:tetratricopeptide (TPR) repeat protein
VPAEALAALARLGQVAKALGYADLVQDPETHHAAYLAIAGALVESGASAEDVLRQALAAIPAIRDEQGRIEALESAIQLLAVARDGEGLGRALSIADTIENAAARALAFARIAAGLTEAGEPAAETVATSLAVAGSIEGDGSVRVLVGVAQVLAEQHLLEQASQALTEAHARAGALEDDVAKVRALSHVADGLATIRDAASLREVAFEIVTALERFAVVVRSAEATERLLSAINLRGRAGETQEGLGLASRTTALIDAIEEHHADADVDAQALARSVTLAEKSWAATALARLFVALTHADCDSAKVEVLALAAASDIEDDATMGTILETFVSALPKKDGKPFAADLADRLIAMMDVLDTQSKKGLLSALIPILRNAGEHARLVHAVSSALALADSDPNLRVEVVQMLAEAGDAERALVMADEIIEEKEKADALSRLAATLGRAGQYDQARGLAERIAIPADKAYAWAVVADSLAQAGQEVAASLAVDHALQAADAGREVWVSFQNPKLGMRVPVTLGREQAKADALTVVANALARAGAVDAALKVVDAVEKVGYPSGRATALCAVAKALIEVDDTDQGSDIALKAFLLAEALETSDALGVEAPNSVASTDDQHRHNRVSLGDVLAAELRDPEVRAQTLGWIAQVVASAGARADAVATIDRALASVEALPEEADRSRALFSVLPALATIGYEGGIARAQVVAQGIGDEETIRQVEVVRCEAGNVLPEDRSPYFTIPGAEHKKASALSQIAEALAGAGLDDKAEDAGMQALTLTTISEIEEVTGEVVMRVAPMFGKVRSLRGLDRVSEMARAIRGATIKARALIGVGRGFAALGNQVRAEEESDLALTIVESELDEATQAIAVSSIALNLAKAGRVDRARVLIDRALVIAEEIGDASEKSRAVAEITSRMDEMEYEAGRSRALAVAETIGTEASNAAALLSIAVAFAQAGRKERARQIAEHAVTTITRMQEPSEQAVALGALSNAFLQADANDRALEVAAMAFLAARRASRQTVFEVLGQSAAVIATIDQGETLVRLFGVLQEVDSWWS